MIGSISRPKISLQWENQVNRNDFSFGLFFIKRNRSSRMQENTKSDHFETISNRFLVPKLVCSEKIRLIASFSVSDSFSSRGTDQEWTKRVELVLNCVSTYERNQNKNFDRWNMHVTPESFELVNFWFKIGPFSSILDRFLLMKKSPKLKMMRLIWFSHY